ncbi:MAG: transporter substrate-binding domain-containing protein [Ruminococcus sp.]|nr:transporter substrate-binding domain-containing protein [Ruminococcus sp.]
MKKNFSVFVVFIILIFTVVFTSGCGEEINCTVLLDSGNYPYSYVENGAVKGLEADILNAVAEKSGINLKIITDKQGEFNCTAGELTDGSEKYDYTQPYYTKGIIFTTSSKSGISTYEELLHSKVGVITGSDGEIFANQIAPQYNITVKKYTSAEKMYADCENGKIDGFFDDELTVNLEIKKGRKLKTFENAESTANLTFAVNAGTNKEFFDSFNQGLQSIIDDGTYDRILENYIS